MIVRLHKQAALFNEREINHPGLSNYPQAFTYRSGKNCPKNRSQL